MNEILKSMKTRRSVRRFKSDPVPVEFIQQVLEAGQFAASGHDRQPWIFVAVTNRDVIARLTEVNASFFDMPVKDPFYGAPVVIVVLAKKSVPTYLNDGTLALGNMMLAAHSLGLGSCWINRAKQEFELPEWQNWLAEIGVDAPEEYEGIGHCALGFVDGELPQARPRKESRIFWVE